MEQKNKKKKRQSKKFNVSAASPTLEQTLTTLGQLFRLRTL